LPRNGNKTAACISVRSFQLSTRLHPFALANSFGCPTWSFCNH
jgi:hypothetical protein